MAKLTAKVVYDKLISDILPGFQSGDDADKAATLQARSAEKQKLTRATNIFVNLTGPAREHFLGENWQEGPGRELKAKLGDLTLTVNILSQKQEGELETADYNGVSNQIHIENALAKVQTMYKDQDLDLKNYEVWSMGGSSTQQMFPEGGGSVQYGNKNAIASNLLNDFIRRKDPERKIIILYNAIGYSVPNAKGYFILNNMEDGEFTEFKDASKEFKKVFNENKDVKDNIIVVIGRTEKGVEAALARKAQPPSGIIEGSHLRKKYDDTLKGDDPLLGVEISSGQVKTYDGAKFGYLYKKKDVKDDAPMKELEDNLKEYAISTTPDGRGFPVRVGAPRDKAGLPREEANSGEADGLSGGARRRRNRKSRKNKAKKSRKARSRAGNSARKSRRGRGRGRGRRTRRN